MTRFSIPTSPSEHRRFLGHPLVGGQRETTEVLEHLKAGRCVRFVGPRYHHKSKIMRLACKNVNEVAGYISLYISLQDARLVPVSSFFALVRDLIITKTLRYVKRRLTKIPVTNEADLTRFLDAIPDRLNANIVLFVDDLEEAVPEALPALLRSLRSAYENTSTGLRFLSVVCASHGLARVALGPTSPFENISRVVFVYDLNRTETQTLSQLLLKNRYPQPDPEAFRFIYEQTKGDRFLVSELCRVCCELAGPRRKQPLSRVLVAEAIRFLIQHAAHQPALSEGLQYLERDPNLLEAILRLMSNEEVPASELDFDPTEKPDPLTMSGFVIHEQNSYRLKSRLHQELLNYHFTPERLGRLFAAAGRWTEAIEFLGAHTQKQRVKEDRDAVVLTSANAMYSVKTKAEAFKFLVHGLEKAYPGLIFCIYDFVKETASLRQVYPVTPRRLFSIESGKRPETRALKTMHDYDLHSLGGNRLQLLVPLRATDIDLQGLVVAQNLVTRRNRRTKQEIITQFVANLRHVARALSNRQQYEYLHLQAEQYATDLSQLLELTRALISKSTTYAELLKQTLESALIALARRAQAGSIYLYERRTDHLKLMVSHTYAESLREKARFKPGFGLAGYVYKIGHSYIVNNAESDEIYLSLNTEEAPPVKSAIGVPLVGRHGPIGVLCLDNLEQFNVFNADSERLLNLFAGQIAPWLENLRLGEVLRDLNNVMAELRDLWSPDSVSFLDKLASRLKINFDLNGCAVGLRSTGDYISFVVRDEMPDLTERMNTAELPKEIVKRVLESGLPLAFSRSMNHRREWRKLVNKDISALTVLPLQGEQGNYGLLLLASVGEFKPTQAEINLLQSFTSQLTITLQSARRINFDLEYQGKSKQHVDEAIDNIHQARESLIDAAVLKPQAYDLLGTLFYNARALWVNRPLQGLSGSAVLQVKPTFKHGGVGQPMIVKVGRRDKIRTEANNYRDYVQPYLQHQHTAQLSAQYTRDLGVLLYTLVESGDKEPITLEKFYQKHPAQEIVGALHRLFRNTCSLWYTNTRTQIEMLSLRDLYLQAFALEKVERLEQEAVETWPQLDLQAPQLNLWPNLGALPNPLHWLHNHDLFMETSRCFTHGDLNAGNIIISEGNQFWLIDFYRTGPSHIFRDFVILETDLKFRLAADLTIEEFTTVEMALLQNRAHLTGLEDWPAKARKLGTIISALRAEARAWHGSAPHTLSRESQQEYLASLLMGTLNVLRLRHFKETPHLQSRRELALLSAALICQRLQDLGMTE